MQEFVSLTQQFVISKQTLLEKISLNPKIRQKQLQSCKSFLQTKANYLIKANNRYHYNPG